MDITEDMLQAAVRKAIEAGLLPRNACRDDASGSKELMRLIVQAALSAGPRHICRNDNQPPGKHAPGPAYPGTRDVKRTTPVHAYS